MALLLNPRTLDRLTTLPSQHLVAWCLRTDIHRARQAQGPQADTLTNEANRTAVAAQGWTQKGLYVAAFAPAETLSRLPMPFNFLMQWPILSRMVGTYTISKMLQGSARDLAAQANHVGPTGKWYQAAALACMAAAMLFTEIPACVFVAAQRSVLEMGYYAGYAVGAATHTLRHLHVQHGPHAATRG